MVVSAYRTESTSSGSLWQVEAYSYNKKGNLEKKGVYTDLSNSSALPDLTLFYEYNLLNEVAKVKKGIGADTLYESYTYNTLGQVVDVYSSHEPIYIPQLTCEDEEFCFVEYFFNNRHQKTSTVYTPLGQVQRQRFHKAPLLTTEQGTVELYGMNYQYDIRDRLSAINSVSSAQYGTEKFAARYHYNEVSQLWKAEYYNPTVSGYSNFEHRYQMIYNYDSLNRLKETYYQSHKDYNAWNSSQGYEYGSAYQEQLAYDANGNVLGLKRTDKTGYMVDHLSLTYKSGTNQLMSVSDAAGANKLQGWDAGSSTNQYDLNGNLISGDGATNIVYDVRNLPIRMQKGGQTIIYRYNAAGQRIYKKVIGTTITEEHYVMNGSELVAVLKNGVVDYWRTSYGRYERINGTFRAKYYITDHLGSTRVVLDESGQRVEAYDYYAFGLVLPGRGFGNTTKEKFTGKERDSETGWDYFGARYYNPAIARWMNVDPLAEMYPSWTPYNYAANNPVQITDINGTCWHQNSVINPDTGLYDVECFKEGETRKGWNSIAGQERTITGTINGVKYDKARLLMNADGSVSEIKDALNATLGVALPVGTGLIPETTSPWLAPKVGPVGQNGLGMGLFIGALIGILADATTDVTTPDDTGKPGHTYYHGTSYDSAISLLGGAPLSLVNGEHMDGELGFYLASDYWDTTYYALRRDRGTILKYEISDGALGMLLSSGSTISPMPILGNYGAPSVGSQLYVPPVSFMVFDMLRNSGQIIVTPAIPTN